MKNFTQLIVAGLVTVGVGVVGYRAHKMKQLSEEIKEENVVEIEVAEKDKTRK